MPETTPTAGGDQPQTPPMGVSSATGPTPNKGYEAAAVQRLGLVVKQLSELIPLAGATSEIGGAAMDALRKLSKLVPPGAVSPAAEQNNLQRMSMQNTQNSAMAQQMKQQMGGGEGGGAPSMPKAA